MFERATVISALLVLIGLVWATTKYYQYLDRDNTQVRIYLTSLKSS